MEIKTSSIPETRMAAVCNYLHRPVHIAPLVIFRIVFGVMMLFSTIRFWAKGWISDLYVKPGFYFPLMDLNWVRPLGNTGMHLLFFVMAITALLITIGWAYRLAVTAFFLSFTYVEFIDVTNYLNHYYFITLVSFLMIWLPANSYFSLDAHFQPAIKKTFVPAWTIGIIRLQLGFVYVFAGLAKLSPDWLLEALPMKIWLPAKSHLPLVGPLMYKEWVAYLFSWFGAAYDLLIVFFLLNKTTRNVAYIFVVIFHLATALFFPGIGMFPYVMILSSLVFFDAGAHRYLLKLLGDRSDQLKGSTYRYQLLARRGLFMLLGFYCLLQLLLPLRFLIYPNRLFWSEEGYRFSWRVMLMEKSGNTFFYVKETSTGKTFEVDNSEHLTPMQEKMMSTQPDMLIQYAHYLHTIYQRKGMQDPAVFAEGYVALNGRPSRLYIDTNVDLAKQTVGWQHYTWILPFDSTKKN